MASGQVPLGATLATGTNGVGGNSSAGAFPDASIHVSPSFKIHQIDDKYEEIETNIQRKSQVAAPPLGVLSNFTGTFQGRGFNIIFRPNSGGPNGTTFKNPVSPPPPNPPSENVLEINLTTETLAFSPSIGSIPNRGLGNQGDIFLNGVPYLQTVNDVANPDTGKANGPANPIHLEPGLWIHIPATTVDPVLAESLTRMASIPHGTTINAQGLAPTTSFNGPPKIDDVDPRPFPIGVPTTRIPFISLDVNNKDTPRIPQDLTKFIAAGTITQKILSNPNQVLKDAIANQKIIKTVVIKISTASSAPEIGGGTANIAFLTGDPKATGNSGILSGPNAISAQMEATFWVETVEKTINLPVWKLGQPPIHYPAEGPHPPFLITPPQEIPQPRQIVVHYTQIQYTQTVLLNFATLSWPHISVATLTPANPVVPNIIL